MSNLNRFLKKNKTVTKNEMYAPTTSQTNEDGSPLMWEFRHISSKRNEELQEENTVDIPIKGKPNATRQRLNTSKYLADMIVESTVVPDLYNKELQDSYGVKNPSDLLFAMVDNPGEYQDLCIWVQNLQGFKTMANKVDEAKN